MTTLSSPAPTTSTVTDRRVPRRTVVASLWLFVLLCYLYCDVLTLFRAEDLRAVLSGEIGGVVMSDGFLLGASVLMTIPIGMVLVSRVAPHRVARWGTVVAASVMTVVQVGSLFVGETALHYAYFSAIEITTTVVLAWYAAARWRADD
ncbi:hypothetical protein GXP71_16970 [Cellulomonas sp. H30R-01]|uniref:DUF6326 family protein n=1 Tax=Cellulomonas sp. H30R-01 TaxID=2704467 RepID=UPI00138C0EA9|nr:DUF6326 family protein [Cellulomonas sp. H30R-01]QHT57599.1 hypothetical protein GXP71_16970 [Cellulomonas sp. H30R-01]